tara:strand:+ start:143 stop:307 length:165 start_codon:yes stop_codon:yes gene_type:complete
MTLITLGVVKTSIDKTWFIRKKKSKMTRFKRKTQIIAAIIFAFVSNSSRQDKAL